MIIFAFSIEPPSVANVLSDTKMISIKITNNKALGCIILLALASCTNLFILQDSIVRIDSPAVTLEKTKDEEISYSSSYDYTYLDNNPLSYRAAHSYATHDSPGKGEVSNANAFLVHFNQAVNATYNKSAVIPAIPLFLRNMTLYCPLTLRNLIMNPTSGLMNRVRAAVENFINPHPPSGSMNRARAAVEMIQTVSDLNYHGELEGSFLPIFILIDDKCGCNISDGSDKFKYPRLSWALPATKYSEYFGSKWCNTIGFTSYETWFSFHSHKKSSSWDSTFQMYSKRYPWNGKLKKAVWRGTTTYEPRFKGFDLSETPRGKLVQLSMTNSGLIDAAFVALVQQYESQKDALTNKTILADMMRFDDQMKYKAIIDIDGNNWSSRFAKLLCTNSVVIKVEPEFIEYFYDELKPNHHYVPASLDNLTKVAEYVLDDSNENEMKRMVDSANYWCKRKMTASQLAKDSVLQLRKYKAELDDYINEHNISADVIESLSGDLVQCYSA